MDNLKNDKYYLEKMLEYINYIEEYSNNIKQNKSTVKANDQDSDGILYKIIQLKEESKNISIELLDKYPSFKKKVSLLTGFRNRLTHDYNNLSYSYLDEILEDDIPNLKKEIKEIMEKES